MNTNTKVRIVYLNCTDIRLCTHDLDQLQSRAIKQNLYIVLYYGKKPESIDSKKPGVVLYCKY